MWNTLLSSEPAPDNKATITSNFGFWYFIIGLSIILIGLFAFGIISETRSKSKENKNDKEEHG